MAAEESPSRPILSRRFTSGGLAWAAITLRLVWWLTLVAGGLTIFGFFAGTFWCAELLCHFRAQYAVCLAAATLLFGMARQWIRMAMAAGFMAVNGLLVVPLYFALEAAVPRGPSWRILEMNLLASNSQRARVLATVRQIRPDVAVFLEFDPAWNRSLEVLTDELPYTERQPREGAFGIAVFSRYPLADVRHVALGRRGVPAIVTEVQRDQERWTLIAVHVLPPMGADPAADRNRGLAQAAEIAARSQHPAVLVGDLNCTSWTPAFAELERISGLRDSRKGFGVQPTWPSNLPGLRIPIDHFLVSPSLAVRNRFVGPAVGSDHFPVVIELEEIRP